MSKQERLTAREAEALLFRYGFDLVRITGSYHVYIKCKRRIVVPHHGNKILHPKIIKQILSAIAEVEP